jgi:translation initiation factor 5B
MRKPAIMGIRVLKGRVRNGQRILRDDGRVVGEIQSIREEDNPISEAEQGAEVAIAVDGVQIGRQMDEGEIYYVDIPEGDFQDLSDYDLTIDEQEVKQQVAEIKREVEEPYWGM